MFVIVEEEEDKLLKNWEEKDLFWNRANFDIFADSLMVIFFSCRFSKWRNEDENYFKKIKWIVLIFIYVLWFFIYLLWFFVVDLL